MAVVGSSLFGMISGIAAANTVAVGVVTIPLMKRSGMPAKLAAAVEACASNGGQLMPPVMGAVAFVMADFLQLPYKEVAIAAILPSVMYYAALFIQADLEAARYGFGKVDADKIPRAWTVLQRGWLFLAPFVVLVYTMFWRNLEPEYCAMSASVVIIVLGFAFGYGGQRMKLRDLWDAVTNTATGLCEILVISAAAGFIMGLFQVSGLAFAFAAYLVQLGGQSLILLLDPRRRREHHPRHGAADHRRVRHARDPGRAGAGQGRRAAARGAPLHPLLRHDVAHHAAGRARGLRRRGDRRLALDGHRLDGDALRLELVHRAVPLRLLAGDPDEGQRLGHRRGRSLPRSSASGWSAPRWSATSRACCRSRPASSSPPPGLCFSCRTRLRRSCCGSTSPARRWEFRFCFSRCRNTRGVAHVRA